MKRSPGQVAFGAFARRLGICDDHANLGAETADAWEKAAYAVMVAYPSPPESDAEPQETRPANMTELAQAVAKELRKRAVLADDELESVVIWRFVDSRRIDRFSTPRRFLRSMLSSDFDNLTPSEIADVIQAEEAKKAAEWAGDE